MSYTLETLNRGRVEDCGFIFGDAERIRLGALPAMEINQFATYSTDTLLQILASGDLNPNLRTAFAGIIAFDCGRMVQSDIEYQHASRNKKNPEEEQLLSRIKAVALHVASTYGNDARNYTRNPFVLEDGKVKVSNFYELDVKEFVYFASSVIAGGVNGWAVDTEIPKGIKTSASRLMQEIERKPSR